MRRWSAMVVLTALVALSAAGCTAGDQPREAESSPRTSPTAAGPAPSGRPPSSPSAGASASASASPSSTTTPEPPPSFQVDTVLDDIETLAEDYGPREATSANFRDAARLVGRRLDALGYTVRREEVPVPAGTSWGVPVRAGTSQNLVADPPAFDERRPHRVIGAHLDTVPQAPGAEDNASGVAVLLELARMAAARPGSLPVRFIVFGAEEPRGDGESRHHYGSRQHVADLSAAERRAVAGMVALDRVGVRAPAVPVCRTPRGGSDLVDEVRDAAQRVDVPTRSCESTTSDHWSYAQEGVPAIRLGSVPYAGYHSAGDVPSVVDRRQLDRVGRIVWVWVSH